MAEQESQLDYAFASETVATAGANRAEVATAYQTLGKLNNGTGPVTLANNTLAGPGHVTWAFEWDLALAPGAKYLISDDNYLEIYTPEPSPSALLAVGGFLIFAWRNRRQRN